MCQQRLVETYIGEQISIATGIAEFAAPFHDAAKFLGNKSCKRLNLLGNAQLAVTISDQAAG